MDARTRWPPLSAAALAQALPNLLHGVQDGVQIWAPDGALIYAKPATLTLFGLPPEATPLSSLELTAWAVDPLGAPLNARGLDLPDLVASAEDGLVLAGIRCEAPAGVTRWLRLKQQSTLSGPYGETWRVTTCADVSHFVAQEQALQQQAFHDALTGLPNRLLLADRLPYALAAAQRRDEGLAVCVMDLDGFKPVNDMLGHQAGDRVLQEIAHRLRAAMRGEDLAARMGGDEFALVLGGLSGVADCELVLKRILRDLSRPVDLGGGQLACVSASIGVAMVPGHEADAEQLLRHADEAMYQAKAAGKGRFHMFDPAAASRLRVSRTLISKIQQALDQGQFYLLYQPLIDCQVGEVVGLEALIRWRHPVLGERLPAEFLPLVAQDDTGLRVGAWVLHAALAQIRCWDAMGLRLPITVNVQAHHFCHEQFHGQLRELLEHVDPALAQRLGLELTESAALEDLPAVARQAAACRALGVCIGLDGFGSGRTSLSQLSHLPARSLKIDPSLVRDMLADERQRALVQGVVGLARAFGLQVVGVGVEQAQHVAALLALGCHVMQGFHLARPLAPELVPAWLAGFRPDPAWSPASEFLEPSRTGGTS